MTQHIAGNLVVPCQLATHGRCRTCELIDRDSPHYSEGYRRAFHPEEFPAVAPAPAPAPARLVNLGAPGLPQAPAPAPAPTIPLAGDLVEAMAHRIGADRLAKWVAAKIGKDCGCPERKAKLNRLDAAARRYLKRLGG